MDWGVWWQNADTFFPPFESIGNMTFALNVTFKSKIISMSP